MVNNISRRRFLGAAGAVGLGAIGLAGCGGGSGGADGLTYFSYDPAESAALERKLLAQYKAAGGPSVRLDTLPGSGAAIYPGKLRTEMLGGHSPDVFRIWGGQIAAPFATSQQVISLDDYYKKYGWDAKVNASNVKDLTFGGHKYGVPLWASAVGVWYRRDLFQKAGAAEPKTYDDLEKVNAQLKKAGVQPWLAGGKFGWYVMRFFEYFLEVTAGPALHDQLLTGATSWNRKEVIDAFGLLKKWADQQWLPPGVLGLDPTQVEAQLAGGKGAMILDGQWMERTIVTSKANPALFDTFIPPTGHDTRFSGFSEGLMIPDLSENADAAAKLIDFHVRPAAMQAIRNSYSAVKRVPADASYPLTQKWNGWQAKHPHYLIQDQAFPASLANTYFSIQSDVIQGRQTTQDAAKALAAAVDQWKKSGT